MVYDLTIIGAGWAGFNAAVAAAKLGKSVCLIEERELGGTCLNRGCIPAKIFVVESKKNLSLPDIQKRKTEIISRLSAGMQYLLKTHHIEFVRGHASLLGSGRVSVEGGPQINSKFVLLATGSFAREVPGYPFDHKHIISSDDVLEWQQLPKSLLIVGGGFIGCEFAAIFRRMGVEVTIVELEDRLLSTMDMELGKTMLKIFGKQGIQVMLKTSLDHAKPGDFEKVLVSVGRKSLCEGFNTPSCEVKIEKNAIQTDRYLATNLKDVYAAGDAIGGYLLAHIAAYEGELAVGNMFGKREARDYGVVPASVFTLPEMASVGLTEQEAKAFGTDYQAKTVHYLSVGMAHVLGDTQGFVKVIVDVKKELIAGATLIGADAPELVNLFSVIIKNKIKLVDLKKTIFAHPSLSEIVAEIARSF